MAENSLASRDMAVIWHPYTRQKNRTPPLGLVRGQGALLFDEGGRGYIDASSSWWVNLHGHAHPYIAESIYRQALQLEHVIFAGYTHEPAVRLAERLLPKLPRYFSRVFYSDNGSTAVEVALKMAIQYWWNKGVKRPTFIAFHHSYHGDTFGAMSVSERSIFTMAFRDYLFDVVFIDTPTGENIDRLRKEIRALGAQAAAFIYEPLLQGAGGMRMYEAAHLDPLLETCKEQGILCIADEVMTGFGRTGKLFASEYTRIKPDIICLSKGISGGTLALGLTACTDELYQPFVDDDKLKTLFHGHSFTANPITCAAALASLDLLEDPACADRRERIHRQHEAFRQQIKNHRLVKNVRVLGTVVAFDLDTGDDGYLNDIGAALAAHALEQGVMLRPMGNNVYVLPPYCITEEELEQVYACITDFLRTRP